MTLAEIYAELQDIDRYLGNIDPAEERETVTIRGRKHLEVDMIRKAEKRRAVLVRKLKREHGIDYDARLKAEEKRRTRKENASMKKFAEALAKADPTFPVRLRLEQLCRELHCEYLLQYGDKTRLFPHLTDVCVELQRHPNDCDRILKTFGLEHEDPSLILDLMRRATQP